MLEFIRTTLEKTMELSERQVPKTKHITKSKYVSIDTPSEFPQFIKDNNIPEDCHFYAEDNNIYLAWNEVVETTQQDKQEALKSAFNRNTILGFNKALEDEKLKYTRKPYDHSDYKKRFGNATIYDLYINGNNQDLEDYFFLFYKEVKE